MSKRTMTDLANSSVAYKRGNSGFFLSLNGTTIFPGLLCNLCIVFHVCGSVGSTEGPCSSKEGPADPSRRCLSFDRRMYWDDPGSTIAREVLQESCLQTSFWSLQDRGPSSSRNQRDSGPFFCRKLPIWTS